MNSCGTLFCGQIRHKFIYLQKKEMYMNLRLRHKRPAWTIDRGGSIGNYLLELLCFKRKEPARVRFVLSTQKSLESKGWIKRLSQRLFSMLAPQLVMHPMGELARQLPGNMEGSLALQFCCITAGFDPWQQLLLRQEGSQPEGHFLGDSLQGIAFSLAHESRYQLSAEGTDVGGSRRAHLKEV